MTTVSGPVKDTLLAADDDMWTFTGYLRAHNGGIITSKPRLVKPIGGVLTVDLPPGPVLITVADNKIPALVPQEDCTLEELVAAAFAYPPDTPAELLAAAVGRYVLEHADTIAFDDITRDGTDLLFKRGGETLASTDISDLVFDGTLDDLTDAQAYGKALVRAVTQAAARAAINAAGPDEVAAAVIGELNKDNTVAAAIAAAVPGAVTAEIAGRNLVNGQNILIDSVLWAIVDNANRQALAILADGSTRIYKLDPASLTDGSIAESKLSPSVQSQLVPAGVGSMFDTITEASGYLWAIVDSAGRIALGIKTDGSVVIGKLAPAASPVQPLVPELSNTTPNRKLWALNHVSGVRTLITASNDPREALEDNGAILFTDSNGRKAYIGGQVIPAYPDRSTFVVWGDSWTEGLASPWWTDQLDAGIAASVINKGKSGQTADEIAIRQGGYVLQLTVSGGSIPASGAVIVSTAQSFLIRTDNPWSQVGTLAGVPGTLARASGDPAGQFTFTRTTSGSVVTVSVTTPFISADAVTYESNPQLLFCGRNDVLVYGADVTNVVERVVAAYDAMVSRIRSYHKEFLILGTVNGSSAEGRGSYYWLRVTGINNALAAKYGSRFVDLRQYVNQQVIYDLGLTPDSTDLANMAADMPPPQVMANTGHFNQAAALKTADMLIKPKLDQLGWTL